MNASMFLVIAESDTSSLAGWGFFIIFFCLFFFFFTRWATNGNFQDDFNAYYQGETVIERSHCAVIIERGKEYFQIGMNKDGTFKEEALSHRVIILV